MILPQLPILIIQPFLLLREPIRLIGSGFRDKIDFEMGGAEDLEGVKGFGYEET